MSTHSLVLETCRRVCSTSKHVHIDQEAVKKSALEMPEAELRRICSPSSFDADLHFVDRSSPEGEELTVQYLLVIDALNFCFWPVQGLEYEHLSKGVKAAVLADSSCISADRLACIDSQGVAQLIGRQVPLQEERARLLREVGSGLLKHYGGKVANLIRAAGGSGSAIVDLVTATFPGFRDHAVYEGQQVFFYKRAQIFVGDVYGALQGQGLGAFHDTHTLTMFADYRVPVVLRVLGILQYSDHLEQLIQSKTTIPAGHPEELEIRAATVWAVELLRAALQARADEIVAKERQQQAGVGQVQELRVLSVCLDWWLWEEGEKNIAVHPPHHRTLTVYY